MAPNTATAPTRSRWVGFTRVGLHIDGIPPLTVHLTGDDSTEFARAVIAHVSPYLAETGLEVDGHPDQAHGRILSTSADPSDLVGGRVLGEFAVELYSQIPAVTRGQDGFCINGGPAMSEDQVHHELTAEWGVSDSEAQAMVRDAQ